MNSTARPLSPASTISSSSAVKAAAGAAGTAGVRACREHGVPFIKLDGVDFNINYCPVCEAENVAAAQAEEAKVKRARLLSGIPYDFHNAMLTDFDPTLIAPVIKWADNPQGFIYVTGGCGAGKTYLACAVKRRLNERGVKRSQFVPTVEMFLQLRKSFGKTAAKEEERILAEYAPEAGNSVMIYDDVGSQKATDYIVDTWFLITDRLKRNSVPTMITTNLSGQEMAEALGDRTASRMLSGGVYINLGNEDRRMSQAKKHWTTCYD